MTAPQVDNYDGRIRSITAVYDHMRQKYDHIRLYFVALLVRWIMTVFLVVDGRKVSCTTAINDRVVLYTIIVHSGRLRLSFFVVFHRIRSFTVVGFSTWVIMTSGVDISTS